MRAAWVAESILEEWSPGAIPTVPTHALDSPMGFALQHCPPFEAIFGGKCGNVKEQLTWTFQK